MPAKALKFFKNLIHNERDKDHILDIAQFYKENEAVCIGDITNGDKVMLKVSEYGSSQFKEIREKAGLSHDFLLNAFSPRENEEAMT